MRACVRACAIVPVPINVAIKRSIDCAGGVVFVVDVAVVVVVVTTIPVEDAIRRRRRRFS